MAKIFASGDWHDNIVPLALADSALKNGYLAVLPGDLCCALENGWEVYRKSFLIRELTRLQATYGDQLIILEGNHDPKNPFLQTRMEVVVDGIYFCHGHRFDRLWGWLPIYRFPVPRWIQRMYYTPGKKKKGKLRDWHAVSRRIEDRAQDFAIKYGYKGIVIGHNHLPAVIEREIFTYGNHGDFVDSNSYLEIDTTTMSFLLKYY